VERAKPQAATKFLSHASKNVSHKSRKPAWLKAFSFKDYQLITKLISIMDSIDNQTAMEFWRQIFSDYPILSDGQGLPCRQSMQCAGGVHVNTAGYIC